jgi:hypothetical protein
MHSAKKNAPAFSVSGKPEDILVLEDLREPRDSRK